MIEVFPSLVCFCPDKLAWDVEAIRDEHEPKIRATVLEILQNTCSSEAPAESADSLFNSVMDLGTELLSAALDRSDWIDDYNPPEIYDETADALYQDALDFAKQKYQSVASEIPGLGFEIRPDLLVVMRTTWLRIREEAKRDVHGWSKQIREQNARLDQEAGLATQSASPPTAAGSGEGQSVMVPSTAALGVTIEAIPGTASFVPRTLTSDGEAILEKHQAKIRASIETDLEVCDAARTGEHVSTVKRETGQATQTKPTASENMHTISDLLRDIDDSSLPSPRDALIDGLEATLGRHIAGLRGAIPFSQLPSLGQLSGDSWKLVDETLVVLAGEILSGVFGSLISHNAGVYEETAESLALRVRDFIVRIWGRFVGEQAPESDYFCFVEQLDITIHEVRHEHVARAWRMHEESYRESAKRIGSVVAPKQTRAVGNAGISADPAPESIHAELGGATDMGEGSGDGTSPGLKLPTRQRPGKERKGDASLLAGKRAVNFKIAEQYLGLTERQRQNLVKGEVLVVEGKGHNKKITTDSLRAYLPPENPN